MYLEQLSWFMYYKAHDVWENTPTKNRKGVPPRKPGLMFENEEGKAETDYLVPPDISDTIPVEEG